VQSSESEVILVPSELTCDQEVQRWVLGVRGPGLRHGIWSMRAAAARCCVSPGAQMYVNEANGLNLLLIESES
jgi:hypothetical protein